VASCENDKLRNPKLPRLFLRPTWIGRR
jgi:hypothetical protein